jgi:Domain of unknown function (DUF305)
MRFRRSTKAGDYSQEAGDAPVAPSDLAYPVAFALVVAASMVAAIWAVDVLSRPQIAASTAATPTETRAEGPFLAVTNAAMTDMMTRMAAGPTGDVDRDFVSLMVLHHQGAIDMAMVVLQYGQNEQLRRLAQEIIVTQQQEIAAMRLAVGEPLPFSIPSLTQPSTSPNHRPAFVSFELPATNPLRSHQNTLSE